MVTLYYTVFLHLKVIRPETSENHENMFHCSEKIIFESENRENKIGIFIKNKCC